MSYNLYKQVSIFFWFNLIHFESASTKWQTKLIIFLQSQLDNGLRKELSQQCYISYACGILSDNGSFIVNRIEVVSIRGLSTGIIICLTKLTTTTFGFHWNQTKVSIIDLQIIHFKNILNLFQIYEWNKYRLAALFSSFNYLIWGDLLETSSKIK